MCLEESVLLLLPSCFTPLGRRVNKPQRPWGCCRSGAVPGVEAAGREQSCFPLPCPALRTLIWAKSHCWGRAALYCSSFRHIFPISSPAEPLLAAGDTGDAQEGYS